MIKEAESGLEQENRYIAEASESRTVGGGRRRRRRLGMPASDSRGEGNGSDA
jgi:hypothetical protein